MAKRAPANEEPYRPLLDAETLAEAMSKPTPSAALPRGDGSPRQSAAVDASSHNRPGMALAVSSSHATRSAVFGHTQASVGSLAPRLTSELRVLMNKAERQALERLVTSIGYRLNSLVKPSHVLRALMSLALNAEAEVDRRAGEHGPVTRPPNGDPQAIERFQREIAGILAAAIRDAGPPL